MVVLDVLKSDDLTTGPKIIEFEKKAADYVGAKYAVAVNSGTAALHIACLAVGLNDLPKMVHRSTVYISAYRHKMKM